jgi:hypothetical protein
MHPGRLYDRCAYVACAACRVLHAHLAASAHRTYSAFAIVYQILLVVFMSQAGPARARPHLHRDRARHRRFRLTPLGSPRRDAVSRSAWYSAASEIVL